VQDISKRRTAEKALRESEEQLRTVTDNLPALICYVGRDERFRFVNRTAEIWFARPAGDIIGARPADILEPGDHETLLSNIEKANAGETTRFEMTLRYPDGNMRTVDATYIPDIDGAGEVRGRFTLIQDVTERKRLEAELLRKERLAAMGQLTGTVAHELRNPLGAIAISLGVIGQKTAEAGVDAPPAACGAARRSLPSCWISPAPGAFSSNPPARTTGWRISSTSMKRRQA
jgi:PAS domain S-box-containing protein